MNAYFRLMRFDKPIGILLLVYPTLWALFLASDGIVEQKLMLIFVTGVILMRSAGCIVNDIADRKIDKLVERTQNRPLASGEIDVDSAFKLFIFLIVLALILVFLTNPLTIKLSVIAVSFAVLYPFTKRWTHLPQFVLGLAFAMSVPMVFSATLNRLPCSMWWLFVATVVWTVIYDTMYAMADREEDLAIGVKSSAVLFGAYDRIILAGLQLLLLAIFCVVGYVFMLENGYFVSIFIVALLMIYHQLLIRNREKKACFKAFLHNHWIGLVVLLGIVFDKLKHFWT
jgi:4-hydroxybenzoate polyprenyltransferase